MLFIWTLPFMYNPIPYGEPDAAIHFRIADDMYNTDKPIIKEPDANPILGFIKGHVVYYPPPFYTGIAIAEILGNDRVIPFFLYIAITCSLIFFSVYFLIRHLYGVPTAMLACIFMIFSFRDRLTFLWGQWATGIALVFLPIILYCWYKYTLDKNKQTYLYITFILLAIQFLIHAAIFSLCVSMLISYSVLFLIKTRKLFFNVKHCVFAMILFLIIVISFAPLQTPLLGERILRGLGFSQFEEASLAKVTLKENYSVSNIERIFKWYDFPQNIQGSYPAFMFSYKTIYYGYWTLPFLLLGIGYLLYKRREKDLLILSMLVGFYIITHTDVIGMYLDPKVIRLFYAESVIFYSVIAIGIMSIPAFFKDKYRNVLKIVCLTSAILLILFFNAKITYDSFNNAYTGIQRLNPYQFEAAEWINTNLPQDAVILYAGIPTFPQQAWFQSVSSRLGVFDTKSFIATEDVNLNRTNYVLMDYSFYSNRLDIVEYLIAWEKENVINNTLIYSKNYLKVYKLDT